MFRRILPSFADSLIRLDHRVVESAFGLIRILRRTRLHGALDRTRDGGNCEATGHGSAVDAPDSIRDK
jgi:hypothetical protein